MKLIYCPACKDLFKLHISKKPKSCMCGCSWGRYLKNGKNAIIGGFAIPIGIDNKSFMRAIKKRSELPPTPHNEFLYFAVPHLFEAFTIPKICATVKDEKDVNNKKL